MKRLFNVLLVSCIAVTNYYPADILSIDRELLFSKSKAGQYFLKQQENLKVKAESGLKKLEQSIREATQRLEKQAPMLTADALTDKQRKIAKEMRHFEREREDRQQDLKLGFQIGYERIRKDQYKIAQIVFKEKNAKLLVDKNAPGVLAVAADADITADVLNKVNSEFEKSSIVKKNA